jgi:hypothetical protein
VRIISPFAQSPYDLNNAPSEQSEGYERSKNESSGTHHAKVACQLETPRENEVSKTDDENKELEYPHEINQPSEETRGSGGLTPDPQTVASRGPKVTTRTLPLRPKHRREYKLVVVGGNGVDKSQLAIQVRLR